MGTIASGIHDNYYRGSVGEFLKSKIKKDADLSFVTAYFTIYAFEALKEKLLEINKLRLLFGEPRVIRSLDPEKIEKKVFQIVDDHLEIGNPLRAFIGNNGLEKKIMQVSKLGLFGNWVTF
ncbi:MAG: hypothetical protein ABII26_13260 [Pseudomonadota bacterium]